MTDGVRLVESVFLPPGRLLRVIAAFLVAVRRFRVVAALRAATRRFRVTAAFRAAEVTIRQLLRRMTRGVWLTICRSAASGAFDAHSISIVPPLVGCSGLLARITISAQGRAHSYPLPSPVGVISSAWRRRRSRHGCTPVGPCAEAQLPAMNSGR